MALNSNKDCTGMELLDLVFKNTDGLTLEGQGDHGNQGWLIADQSALCHGEDGTDNFLDTLLGVTDSTSDSPLWASSPCDSGISEDPVSDHLDSPQMPASPLFDSSVFFFPNPHHQQQQQQKQHSQSITDTKEPDVSIDLAAWESSLFSDPQCTPNTQRSHHTSPYQLSVKDLLLSKIGEAPKQNSPNSLQELTLSDDEKKLLAKEGISLPSQLPLTKYEEKILKKIRRKIRNKQSAQESRKKKKEYIDGLEGRMSACSAQNLELQNKIFQLEKTNMSLMEQLRRLQSMIMNGSNKPAQTRTCVLVLLLSFSLILFPSLQSVSHSKISDLGDTSMVRVQSRSLRSVVEVDRLHPVFSLEKHVETASSVLAKLQVKPGYADMDPLPHNRSYGDQDHLHGDPITGRVATLSWLSQIEAGLLQKKEKK
ncbi:cyclic AMP-responsive element-binding protein 3-like protein 3-B [Chanos chanos]|uniref:Cyclic AMP-responsive element-binding protein 3-like protein 3-B n=1 Tax=Chanos chanos TaxID=29144 RepID=A0A6J2V9Z1_CHACN|nr:cyclic AMP-responsive element-binding protein 3-like protein 3-B [Chanos chanos]